MYKVITLIVLASVCSAQAQYSGGSGTAEDPYQIATAADLIALGEEPNDYDKHFILTADIDLDPNLPEGKVFDRAVIAWDVNDDERWFQGTAFTGVFHGNDHRISNLTIIGDSYLGLFGSTDGAAISDLSLEAVDIVGTGNYFGGMVGLNGGSITNCHSAGRVTGGDDAGGLVGAHSGWITTSYSASSVNGDESVGGLVGEVGHWLSSITSTYSTGSVNGNKGVGGLVGENGGSITASYSTGSVSGSEYVGGLVGGSWGWAYGCFWDIQTSGQTVSVHGTGKTTAEMQTTSTFLEAGWDFINVWDIGEGQTYPFLRTHSAGDLNKDGIVNFLDLCIVSEQWME